MRYNLLDEYHLTWKGRDAANSYEVKYSLNVCGTLTVVTLFSQSKAIQFHKSTKFTGYNIPKASK